MCFKNEGSIVGEVRLELQKSYPQLELSPAQFSIQPNEIMKVRCSYTSTEPGIFKGFINVLVESFYNVLNTIEVNATSVDYSVYLIDQKG